MYFRIAFCYFIISSYHAILPTILFISFNYCSTFTGFAYVNFSSKDGVELALALSEEDLTVKNRILRVQRCTQLTQRQKNEKKGKSIQGKNQNFQAKNQNFQPKTQNFQPRNQNFQRNNQGGRNVQNRNQFGNKGGFKPRQGQNNEMGEGAHRRIMNKRKNQVCFLSLNIQDWFI